MNTNPLPLQDAAAVLDTLAAFLTVWQCWPLRWH